MHMYEYMYAKCTHHLLPLSISLSTSYHTDVAHNLLSQHTIFILMLFPNHNHKYLLCTSVVPNQSSQYVITMQIKSNAVIKSQDFLEGNHRCQVHKQSQSHESKCYNKTVDYLSLFAQGHF